MVTFSVLNIMVIGAGSLIACAMLIIAIQAFSLRRLRTRFVALESSVTAMRRELEVVGSISLRTGRRVKRIEQECAAVADRLELVEFRGSAPSFDQAIDSAKRGTQSGALTQHFGLSRVEADLVTRLHGRRRSA